jgi:signal transduction histidine kinase
VSRSPALKRLQDEILEAPDLGALARILTRRLPEALGIPEATLLLWDRKLDTFEALTPGETRPRAVRPGQDGVATPAARFLLSEGELLETSGKGGEGEGVLVPLLARSGLMGMLVLGPRPGRRRRKPFRRGDARLLGQVAARAALALENHLFQRGLIESERMAALGAMAGMLAHDFRGPMTVIRGYAETLAEGGLDAEEVRRRCEIIMEMVDRLERMTMETLDFARGGGRLALRSMDAAEVVEAITADLAEQVPTLELVRSVRVPRGSAVAVDLDKLRRAATNIAQNARDAMGGQGLLHVSPEIPNGHAPKPAQLELVLADEGPGVPGEIRDRLFDPFVTLGKKGGTGLGLAVARRFVEDHGGTLELLPDSAGPGARFRILLPLEDK